MVTNRGWIIWLNDSGGFGVIVWRSVREVKLGRKIIVVEAVKARSMMGCVDF